MRFPDILILGATSRIGKILHKTWPSSLQTRWQTRQPLPAPFPGWVSVSPLSDQPALQAAAAGCQTILCLSGVIPGRVTPSPPLSDNVDLALAAIEAGAATGARVLLCSSAAVYGNHSLPLHETSPLVPAAPYGQAKLEMEQAVAIRAQELGVAYCLLRIGNVAGIDSILGGWRPGFTLDQFANGRTPQRSYIGAITLAQVLADLVQAPDLPTTLNIASPDVVEMGKLLDAAGLLWVPRPAQTGAIARVSLDTTRLKHLIPRAATPETPEQMVAQWRELEPHMNTIQDRP